MEASTSTPAAAADQANAEHGEIRQRFRRLPLGLGVERDEA
jgi:hypothetical protein